MDIVDAVAGAIASEPRRRVVERLADGPATVSALAELLQVSVPAVMRHLDRLEEGGLVRRTKSGRVVTVELVPGSLDPLVTWAMQHRLFWGNQLDRMVHHLTAETDGSDS